MDGLFAYKTWTLCICVMCINHKFCYHYNDVIMSVMASQITSVTIAYSTVYWRCRSKKTSKLGVIGLCKGNSPVTSKFPTQKPINAEKVSIWWCHHVKLIYDHQSWVSSRSYLFIALILWCTECRWYFCVYDHISCQGGGYLKTVYFGHVWWFPCNFDK